MIEIKIDIAKSAKLLEFMKSGNKKLKDGIQKGLRKIAQQATFRAKRFAPVKLGHLRRHIDWKEGSNQVTIGVLRHLKYAATQEFGAIIRPVKAKVLHFKVKGKWVFAKRVKIPRYRGRGYIEPAFKEAQKFAQKFMAREIEKTLL